MWWKFWVVWCTSSLRTTHLPSAPATRLSSDGYNCSSIRTPRQHHTLKVTPTTARHHLHKMLQRYLHDNLTTCLNFLPVDKRNVQLKQLLHFIGKLTKEDGCV
eukprot:m.100075 g.100075  ORF g.100075 m.100075 type:complete len:103 (-) comp10335_c0_seq1:1416-1724(-)